MSNVVITLSLSLCIAGLITDKALVHYIIRNLIKYKITTIIARSNNQTQ